MIVKNFERIVRFARRGLPRCQNVRNCCTKQADEPEIPRNVLKDVYTASAQLKSGKPYSDKPFKMRLEAGKIYHWCLCGYSKSQPICDGTHRHPHIKIAQKPIRFAVEKTKDYWLCNCKQTSNRPFCDGTHKHAVLDGIKK